MYFINSESFQELYGGTGYVTNNKWPLLPAGTFGYSINRATDPIGPAYILRWLATQSTFDELFDQPVGPPWLDPLYIGGGTPGDEAELKDLALLALENGMLALYMKVLCTFAESPAQPTTKEIILTKDGAIPFNVPAKRLVSFNFATGNIPAGGRSTPFIEARGSSADKVYITQQGQKVTITMSPTGTGQGGVILADEPQFTPCFALFTAELADALVDEYTQAIQTLQAQVTKTISVLENNFTTVINRIKKRFITR